MGSNSSNIFGSFMGFEDSLSDDTDDSDVEQGARIEQVWFLFIYLLVFLYLY